MMTPLFFFFDTFRFILPLLALRFFCGVAFWGLDDLVRCWTGLLWAFWLKHR